MSEEIDAHLSGLIRLVTAEIVHHSTSPVGLRRLALETNRHQ